MLPNKRYRVCILQELHICHPSLEGFEAVQTRLNCVSRSSGYTTPPLIPALLSLQVNALGRHLSGLRVAMCGSKHTSLYSVDSAVRVILI